jgi:hypothetical protein
VAQGVSKALSSNPSTEKKKKTKQKPHVLYEGKHFHIPPFPITKNISLIIFPVKNK